MEVKFSHLAYFVAIAEEQSFSGGALRLHLSQPTLSRQMKELETRLEMDLFVRGKSGVTLTEAGQAFLIRARAMLQSREALLLCMKSFAGEALKVGYVAPSLFGAVGEGIAEMRRRQPTAAIEVVEAAPGRQVDMLLAAEIDVAFLGHFQAEVPDQIQLHSLYPIPLAAVLPASHPLAQRTSVQLGALRDEAFLALREELFPGRREAVAELCRSAGFEAAFEPRLADSLISLFGLVAHGQGVSLVPSCAAAIGFAQVAFVKVEGPLAEVPFLAATRQGHSHPMLELALELCRSFGQRGPAPPLPSLRAGRTRPARAPRRVPRRLGDTGVSTSKT